MNIRIITIIIALAAVCGGATAQQKQGKAVRPMPADYGMKKPTVVGTSKIRIKYAFQPKDIHDPESWIDCGQLLADKGLTLYTSYFVAQNDSALRAWLKANPNKSYYPNGLCLHGRESASWTEYQYGYFYVRDNALTEWAIMPSPETAHYRYTEPWPSMHWTLGSEKQTVCGYQCQRATCHWRGRDFVAWFTPQIPLKSGPWKFGGLPGLIMKVYDTRHVYTWEAVAVENGAFPIYQPEERYYKKSTREKVWKMQGEWNRRFNELSGVLDFNFRPTTQRYPYDPLELE